VKQDRGDVRGVRAVRFILALTLLAAVASAAYVFTGYGRWAQRRSAQTEAQRLSQVAGPTAAWLPGVLAGTPPDASILMVAAEMRDPDWLTAYYLYPRELHVVSPDRLIDRTTALPAAGFILERGQLLTWPDRRPVAVAEAPGGPAEPPASTTLPPLFPSPRGLLALLLTVVTALGWGALALQMLSPELIARVPRHGRWGLALLAGLGVIGAAGFVAAFASLTASFWLTLCLTGGGLAALLLGRRWLTQHLPVQEGLTPARQAPDDQKNRTSSPGATRRKLLRMSGVLLISALAAAGMTRALGEPMHHWDERFQWSYKAKILLHEGGLHGPSFQEADRPHLHRRYPLLLPAVEAHTARLAGGFAQERAVKGLFPIFFVGLLLSLHAALRQRLCVDAAWIPVALCAALPPFHLATRIQGGAIHSGFADMPVAALATALALCLVPGLSATGERLRPAWGAAGLFAGLLFAIKPEGAAFLAAALVIAALTLRHPALRPSRRQMMLAGLAAGVCILAVLALHGSVPTEGTVGYTGDENYLGRLTPAALATGLRTNLPVAAAAMVAAPFSTRWSLFGLLPVAALITGLILRRGTGGSHLLILLIVLPLAADLLAFTLTGSEVRWQMTVALDRLWMQVAPLLILMGGGQLGRLMRSAP